MKVFEYISEIDAFIVNKEFDNACDLLGISEWSSVVWLGRYFMLDQDYGEHWFDNWDEREETEARAKELGLEYDYSELLIVVPERLAATGSTCHSCKMKGADIDSLKCPRCGKDIYVGPDGPCHTDELRKQFWTEVLKSLELSLEFLIAEAREIQKGRLASPRVFGEEKVFWEKFEDRIKEVEEKYGSPDNKA
jgi:hypothetical protein